MKNYFTLSLIIIVLPVMSFIYFTTTVASPVDSVFLSISTFLYSIFTGFFISRQAARFNKVRETVTKFDGLMTNMYRTSSHISPELQTKIAEVLKNHYEKIFESGHWYYHFENKSVTLSSIHRLLDEYVVEEKVTKLSNQALGSMVKDLGSAQDVRKQMLALNRERVPLEQWVLIVFFVTMLIGTVSTLESIDHLLTSVLKSAFVISVLSVIYILYRLDTLKYTEKIMGEESATDVMEIIRGTK